MKKTGAIKALILEGDEQSARNLVEHIEAVSNIKCLVAPSLSAARGLLQEHSEIRFLFCIYNISSTPEQLREEAITQFVYKHHPKITISSIGSIDKSEVTLSHHKILLINRDEVSTFLATGLTGEGEVKRNIDLNIKARTTKKRGEYVIQ